MDFNGDKGSPTMEAALVELEKMRADTGFLGIHAIPMVEDLIKRMRVIDSIDWLEHLVVALQAFTASEVYAVIRAIPMTLRPMRAHSYRCKTYRGSSLGTQITEGMATLQRAGLRYSGETPYGYKVGPDGRTLVEYHAEQRAIALALEQRAAGGTLRGIAAELERRGYLARTGKAFDSRQISRLVKGMKRG